MKRNVQKFQDCHRLKLYFFSSVPWFVDPSVHYSKIIRAIKHDVHTINSFLLARTFNDRVYWRNQRQSFNMGLFQVCGQDCELPIHLAAGDGSSDGPSLSRHIHHRLGSREYMMETSSVIIAAFMIIILEINLPGFKVHS